MILLEITPDWQLPDAIETHEFAEPVAEATKQLYVQHGFEKPWVGYFGVDEGKLTGTCGFKSPPRDGRVELAYFTFPEFEGQGYATQMAARLIEIAQQVPDAIEVFAQTLPEKNASTHILSKLGFLMIGEVNHPEDGLVWEWSLRATD